MYFIQNWQPEQRMNGAGFSVVLFHRWKEMVKKYGLTQEMVDNSKMKMAEYWLSGNGYDTKLFEHTDIRITVGEWGVEHLSVPGNACGLDIDRSCLLAPKGGVVLIPHNVDSIRQASLLLTVYNFYAERVLEYWRASNSFNFLV